MTDVLSHSDVFAVVRMLVGYAAAGNVHLLASPEKLRVNYEAFSSAASEAGPRMASMLTASVFLRVR